MWARAAQNAIAIAGVITLGVWAERNYRSKAYPDHPVIEKTHAELAITLVDWSVGRWLEKLGTELADTPFDGLLKKALRYITNAREYRADKRFGQYCGRGLMPRGKLTKLMKEEPRIVDSVVKSLIESEQILEAVEEVSGNKVRLYYATNG